MEQVLLTLTFVLTSVCSGLATVVLVDAQKRRAFEKKLAEREKELGETLSAMQALNNENAEQMQALAGRVATLEYAKANRR